MANPTQPALDIPAETPTPEQAAATAERDRVREEYRARLAEKLKDPEFRKIEGFPIGTDEAILALSDPPYYTACPNPFIEEWLQQNAKPYDPVTDDYHREPFAADVSEGKNDPIYNAHSYHTKVPHKAIMRYILHYTEPGDVVYDGFCGTGMTGVAAQMCGDKSQIESLGYKVGDHDAITDLDGNVFSKLGSRVAILNDLSPAATFISKNYNDNIDRQEFKKSAMRILKQIDLEYGWMYTTLHDATHSEIERAHDLILACTNEQDLRDLYEDETYLIARVKDAKSKLRLGKVAYTVWSDVYICPACGSEIVFYNAAVDRPHGKVMDSFKCGACNSTTNKRIAQRAKVTVYDPVVNNIRMQAKQVPVLVNYFYAKNKRSQHYVDKYDTALIDKIGKLPFTHWIPTDELPIGHNTEQPRRSHGLSNASQFYTNRNLHVLSAYINAARHERESTVMFAVSAANVHLSKMRRYQPVKPGGTPNLPGTLFISALPVELSFFDGFPRKLNDIFDAFGDQCAGVMTSTGSASNFVVCPPDSVDYIFTDPPFGGNLMYSELNYLWESWLRVTTNNTTEAITNIVQNKGLNEYKNLMARSFAEYYRILRSGRWMTVEFHNSANAVWNAIQESLESVGFILADIRILNKQQGTFKQVTTSSAVKQDLVISCYKPKTDFEQRFNNLKGLPESVLEFLRQHLSMLPVAPLTHSGQIEQVAERTRFLLFDRMVAYHLQKGAPIPLNSAAFYKMLVDQFTVRDDMYYLPDQAAKYDALKSRGIETETLSIFVQDEKSSVQWIRSELLKSPRTQGELTPKFMQELHEWPAHEPRPELRDLLREYFIHDINGVWRVPNPDDERDITIVRQNAMLRLFQVYARDKGTLKTFRREAVVEGFKECYETKQYSVIVSVCERMPEKVFQEIPEFVMFYDIAKDLAPGQVDQTEFVWE